MAKKASKQASLNIIPETLLPATEIHPNTYNPNYQNEGDFYLLVQSIAEDGFTDAIFVHEDGRIVDGEHRWTAAVVLHYLRKNNIPMTESNVKAARERRHEIIDPELMIPVKRTNMDDIKRRVATLRHNRARGDEDMELVAAMFREFESSGALEQVQDSLTLEDEEIERLLSYGKSIMDSFPGEAPTQAWEVRDTVTGQVAGWTDPNAQARQSVSQGASVPAVRQTPTDAVPGLGVLTPGYIKPPGVVRYTFVFNEDEAKMVNRVLGEKGEASRLLSILLFYEEHQSEQAESVP